MVSKIMNKVKSFFVFYKVCYHRTATYLNMAMLAIIIFKQFNIPWRWFPLGLIVVPLITFVIGYLDYKLGFHAEEEELKHLRSPVLRETLEIVRKLERRQR